MVVSGCTQALNHVHAALSDGRTLTNNTGRIPVYAVVYLCITESVVRDY